MRIRCKGPYEMALGEIHEDNCTMVPRHHVNAVALVHISIMAVGV